LLQLREIKHVDDLIESPKVSSASGYHGLHKIILSRHDDGDIAGRALGLGD
jgi:hypothetical protein